MKNDQGFDRVYSSPARRTYRRYGWPAFLLMVLAPLFGEYLLGNLTISELGYLPFLMPLYGAGAVLIRESVRRAGRGPVTMLILGVAYGLFEEGLVDQMLFNRFYFAGQDQITNTYVPVLGIDAWLTLIVLAMHTIWSTYIPITLVESLFPDRASEPWLDTKAMALIWAIFILGSAYLCYAVYLEENFFASPFQLIATSVIIIVLIRIAFARRHPMNGRASTATPSLWVAAGFSLLVSSLYMLTEMLQDWARVVACLLLILVFCAVVLRWTSSAGWSAMHRLALAAGGTLTYAWLGVLMEPESGPKTFPDTVGSLIFALAAITLVGLAVVRLQKIQMKTKRTSGETPWPT